MGRLRRPDGLVIPVSVCSELDDEGYTTIVYDRMLEARSGPNGDSDILLIDPSKTDITPVHPPDNGSQKIRVADKKSGQVHECYLPIAPQV